MSLSASVTAVQLRCAGPLSIGSSVVLKSPNMKFGGGAFLVCLSTSMSFQKVECDKGLFRSPALSWLKLQSPAKIEKFSRT